LRAHADSHTEGEKVWEEWRLKDLALVIASEIRIEMVKCLNPIAQNYSDFKEKVEAALQRDISEGSFSWHLEKLKGSNIIVKNSGVWQLTEKGLKNSETLNKIQEYLV